MLANGIGQNAIDFIRNLYVIYNIEFLDQALVPSTPIAPPATSKCRPGFVGGAGFRRWAGDFPRSAIFHV